MLSSSDSRSTEYILSRKDISNYNYVVEGIRYIDDTIIYNNKNYIYITYYFIEKSDLMFAHPEVSP